MAMNLEICRHKKVEELGNFIKAGYSFKRISAG